MPLASIDNVASTKVGASSRPPPWSRDELILALDLYMADPASPPRKTSKEVEDLSTLLNKLGQSLGWKHGSTFRNPNGVYMKMMNFRRFDPDFQSVGKKGLTRGSKDEEIVWKEFAGDKGKLATVAKAIRDAVALPAPQQPLPVDEDEIAEAVEGRILTRLHRMRERDQELVRRRKAKAMKLHGKLCCEACGFDFAATYGERSVGFIECHHKRAIHTLAAGGEKTTENDLALLCANCHRMVHSARPWLTLEQLRHLLGTGT